MKLLLILLLSFNLYANANKQYEFESKFGFLSDGTLLSSFKDARVALKSWLEEVADEYNGKLEVEFYPDSRILYEDLKSKKLDMIVLDMPFFFKNKKDIEENSGDFWSLTMNNTKYAQYFLIANKSLNAKSFKDIKNRTLSMRNGERVASVWLDKNSLIANKSSYAKVLKKVKIVSKQSTALLNVFFKKTDFAIISKKTWDTMIELNPSITKKVKIISKSKKIHLPFIGLFKKKSNQKSIDAFFSISKNLSDLKGSEQIITLLKFNAIFRVDDESIKILDNYYNEYFKLKKKYK